MIVATLGEHTAHAQSTGFALNRFDAAPAGSDWFTLDSLDMRGSVRPSFQLLADFGYRPLVLYNANGSVNTAVVGDQLFADLGGSVVLADRVRLSLTLPVAAYQHGNSVTFDNVAYNGPNAAALGDLRLDGDVRLFGTYGDPFTVAIGTQLFLPTGNRSLYAGDGSVRLAPHVLAAGQVGIFTYAASLGLVYHAESASYAGTPVGGELTAAASAGLLLADKHLLIGPEIWGRTDITDGTAFSKASSPIEGTMGVHGLTAGGWRLGAGLGTGLAQGLGTPELRVLASISYSPPPAAEKSDRDRDGILDGDDACPDTPGIHTEDPHTNGCPEEAPPPPAPLPPPPPPDRDHDGILDSEDACPDVPGEANTDPARNGCPKAIVFRDTIRILDQVKFRTDSAEILVESDSILDAVRKALEEHPNIQRLDIEGHTDSRGNAAHNRALSEARARSVKTWLTHHGIDTGRLTSHGLGATRPIDSNETEQGRQNNRRVEFHILSTSQGVEEGPAAAAPAHSGDSGQEKRVVAAPPPTDVHREPPPVAVAEPARSAGGAEKGESHGRGVHSKPDKTKIDFDANASALGVVDTNMFDKGTGSVQAVGFDVAGALSVGVPVTRRVSWISGGGLGTNYRDGVSGSVSSADAMRVDANVKTGIEALLMGKSSLPGRKVKKATYPSIRLNLEAKYALWANPLITQPPAASDESADALEPDDDSDSGGGGDTGSGDTGSRRRPRQLAQADSPSGTDASPAGGDDDAASDSGDQPEEDQSPASSGAGPQTFSNPNTHNKVTGLARVTVDLSKRLALVTESTFGRDFVQLDDSVEVSPNYDEITATETAKYQLVPKKLSLSVGYVFERRLFDDLASSGASQDFYVQGAKVGLDVQGKRVKLKFGYDIRAKLSDAGSAKNTTRNQWQVTAEVPIVKHLSAVGEGRFTYTLFDTAPGSARLITLLGLKVKL